VTAPIARVLRGDEATRGTPLLSSGPGPSQVRRIAREELEARLVAERVVAEAREQAAALTTEARERAVAAGAEAVREAQQAAETQLVARWVALRDAESRRAGSDADRLIAVAVALAERLVGVALEIDPSRIAALANGVLAEARGARRAMIEAGPSDAEELRRHLSSAGLESFEVKVDEGLARGALRLHTDVGIIDAQLAPRLERLAAALRDALR
jgi:flagellar biosynthesis/type III secretory pathway protein FliH